MKGVLNTAVLMATTTILSATATFAMGRSSGPDQLFGADGSGGGGASSFTGGGGDGFIGHGRTVSANGGGSGGGGGGFSNGGGGGFNNGGGGGFNNGGGGGGSHSVPEIDVTTGVLAVAAVTAGLMLAYELRRRRNGV